MPDKIHISTALGLSEFVVVDVETTGLDPAKSEIIEIGAVRYKDGKEEEVFSHLVKPHEKIPLNISKLTGIYDKDVADADPISDILPAFSTFAGDLPLVGHNVLFDLNFLEIHAALLADDEPYVERRAKKQFIYFPDDYYDTLELARIFNPVLGSFQLGTVCEHYGITLNKAHRAEHDARSTGELFLKLLEQGSGLGQKTIYDMYALLQPTQEPVKFLLKRYLDFFDENPDRVEADHSGYWNFVVNHYNIIGNPAKDNGNDDDQIPDLISIDDVIDVFSESGDLASGFPSYEIREPQLNMTRAVAEALNKEQFLSVEAGTGTGKSLAYLVPAIEFAQLNREKGQRVIVSTNTKNLQDQLFYKDLPLLSAAMKEEFSAVLLKGKSNYLCLDRFHANISDQQQRLNLYERKSVLPLFVWSQITQTGDISENTGFQSGRNGATWSKFIAENNYCPGRKCSFYNDCYLMKARNQARNADIVIVNHSLTFSDLVADNSILGPYTNIIFDEAHNIEKTATEYLGIDLNYWVFRRLAHRLYRKDNRETGITVQFKKNVEKSSLGEKTKEKLIAFAEQIKGLATDLDEDSRTFFADMTKNLNHLKGSSKSKYQVKIKFDKAHDAYAGVVEMLDPLSRLFEQLLKDLGTWRHELENMDEGIFKGQEQMKQEISAAESLSLTLLQAIAYFQDIEEETMVNWFELPGKEDSIDTQLRAVPLNIAEVLQETLFSQLRSAVFASATLVVDHKFDYFQSRIGINAFPSSRRKGFIAGSPFDFEKQVKVMVAAYLPDPRNDDYSPQLIELIRNISLADQRGMLVLFTSYGLMNQVYENVKFHFDTEHHLLLAQGKDGSRTRLLKRFIEDPNSVLMGTDSFWEGVDVPGEALELVMLTKLPFEVPTDPVVNARMREVEKNGGNSFFDYSVPEAIIKFRQGFGRLIRSADDRGIVIVTDTRVAKMRYGKSFLSALPIAPDIYLKEDQFLDDLKTWFSENK